MANDRIAVSPTSPTTHGSAAHAHTHTNSNGTSTKHSARSPPSLYIPDSNKSPNPAIGLGSPDAAAAPGSDTMADHAGGPKSQSPMDTTASSSSALGSLSIMTSAAALATSTAAPASATSAASGGSATASSSTTGTARNHKPFTSPPSIELYSPSRRSATPSAYSAVVVQSPVQQAFAFDTKSLAAYSYATSLATFYAPSRTPSRASSLTLGASAAHPDGKSGPSRPLSALPSAGLASPSASLHSLLPPIGVHDGSLIGQPQQLPAVRPPPLHDQQHPHHHLVPVSMVPHSTVALPLAQAVPMPHPGLLAPETQDQLLQLAHSKYNEGDFAAALSVLQTLYLVNPHHIATLLLLGCTCYSLGLYTLSIFYNQLILQIDAHFAEAYSNLGTTYRALGDDGQAEGCYRAAVDIRPEYWDGARNLVGVLCSKGKWDEALRVYERAEATIPACDPLLWPADRRRDLYYAKANIHFAMGQAELARKAYIKALACIQVDAEALVREFTKLNGAHPVVVSPQKALTLAQHVVALVCPALATTSEHATTATILQTLAKFHQDAQQIAAALALYYVSLLVNPNPQTCNLVGILCATIGCPPMAVQYYHYGLTIDPNHVHLYTNLGSVLKDQGHIMEAISMYERAVQLNPDFEIALANLANAMKDVGRIDEACNLYRRALHVNPQFTDAFCNFVNTLNFICDWRERDAHFARIRDLTDSQLAQLAGQLAWAVGFGIRQGGSAARMHAVRAAKAQPPPPVPTVLPFHTFVYPLSPRAIRMLSYRNAARMVHNVYAADWCPELGYTPVPLLPGERLRVGYLSSDFGNHPLSHLMQSVFGMHDRARYEVFCYALSANDGSPYRAKIEREAEHLIEVAGWSAAQICKQINAVDRVHVLVNLNGYTKGAMNEVFAARCAPVQVAYMGFAGTLGAIGWIDYFITDPVVCPPDTVFPGRVTPEMVEDLADQTHIYTEKMIYMPHSYFVNDHKQGFRDDLGGGAQQQQAQAQQQPNGTAANGGAGAPPNSNPNGTHVARNPNGLVSGPEADHLWQTEESLRWKMRQELFPGLATDVVILANFNQLYKIDPVIFATWCRILARVPHAMLWLLRFPTQGEQHLKRTAAEIAGPEVASRVVFTDVAPKQIHVSRGRVVDLFLDTPECNAHTTACDILWSGTPVLTFPRHRYKLCSRVAASVALATGLGDRMIVASEKEYEDRAVALALSVRVRAVPLQAASQQQAGLVSQQLAGVSSGSLKASSSPMASALPLAKLSLDGPLPAMSFTDPTSAARAPQSAVYPASGAVPGSVAGSGYALPPVSSLVQPRGSAASTPTLSVTSLPAAAGFNGMVSSALVVPGAAAAVRLETSGELYEMKRTLFLTRETCALFDTRRWVRNLEQGLLAAWRAYERDEQGLENIWVGDVVDGSGGTPAADQRLQWLNMIDSRAHAQAAHAQLLASAAAVSAALASSAAAASTAAALGVSAGGYSLSLARPPVLAGVSGLLGGPTSSVAALSAQQGVGVGVALVPPAVPPLQQQQQPQPMSGVVHDQPGAAAAAVAAARSSLLKHAAGMPAAASGSHAAVAALRMSQLGSFPGAGAPAAAAAAGSGFLGPPPAQLPPPQQQIQQQQQQQQQRLPPPQQLGGGGLSPYNLPRVPHHTLPPVGIPVQR